MHSRYRGKHSRDSKQSSSSHNSGKDSTNWKKNPFKSKKSSKNYDSEKNSSGKADFRGMNDKITVYFEEVSICLKKLKEVTQLLQNKTTPIQLSDTKKTAITKEIDLQCKMCLQFNDATDPDNPVGQFSEDLHALISDPIWPDFLRMIGKIMFLNKIISKEIVSNETNKKAMIFTTRMREILELTFIAFKNAIIGTNFDNFEEKEEKKEEIRHTLVARPKRDSILEDIEQETNLFQSNLVAVESELCKREANFHEIKNLISNASSSSNSHLYLKRKQNEDRIELISEFFTCIFDYQECAKSFPIVHATIAAQKYKVYDEGQEAFAEEFDQNEEKNARIGGKSSKIKLAEVIKLNDAFTEVSKISRMDLERYGAILDLQGKARRYDQLDYVEMMKTIVQIVNQGNSFCHEILKEGGEEFLENTTWSLELKQKQEIVLSSIINWLHRIQDSMMSALKQKYEMLVNPQKYCQPQVSHNIQKTDQNLSNSKVEQIFQPISNSSDSSKCSNIPEQSPRLLDPETDLENEKKLLKSLQEEEEEIKKKIAEIQTRVKEKEQRIGQFKKKRIFAEIDYEESLLPGPAIDPETKRRKIDPSQSVMDLFAALAAIKNTRVPLQHARNPQGLGPRDETSHSTGLSSFINSAPPFQNGGTLVKLEKDSLL